MATLPENQRKLEVGHPFPQPAPKIIENPPAASVQQALANAQKQVDQSK